MRKTYKRPQQGTQSIQSVRHRSRVKALATRIIDDVHYFTALEKDADFELIAQTTPDPEAWKRMVDKYGREEVTGAYRWWRMNKE